MISKIKKNCEGFFPYFFPLIMLSALMSARGIPTIPALLSYALKLFMMVYAIVAINHSAAANGKKQLMTVLVWYTLLSVIGYSYNGRPFLCYRNDITNFILPMLFVYVGFCNEDERIYKWFVNATIFCAVVGLYLYFVQPSWYISYKTELWSNKWYYEYVVTEDNVMGMNLTSRFSSFFEDSYAISYYSAFSLCILMSDILKPVETRLYKSNLIQMLFVSILLLVIVLGQARVTMFFSILIILYCYYYSKRKNNPNISQIRWLILVVVLLAIATTIFLAMSDFGSYILERVILRMNEMSLSDTMDTSRINQNQAVLTAWSNYVTGDGMGAYGGFARMNGYPAITDGAWVRYLCEYGILGLAIFLSIVGSSFFRAKRFEQYLSIEMFIIAYTALSMIGANSLGMNHHITLIFWLAIGRIWNINYLNNKIQNHIHI